LQNSFSDKEQQKQSQKMKEISIIPQEINQDETVLRAIRTFEYLDKLVDEVFDRIDARSDVLKLRIDNVNQR
jgi:hypothetical protein